ncbi:integrase [filamentous cyanobacterium CCT1]|nr:integrase [filamentous cyanobacterium CCT1]PSN81039.1 integrase [filamentous cyanobacterium CCP4]
MDGSTSDQAFDKNAENTAEAEQKSVLYDDLSPEQRRELELIQAILNAEDGLTKRKRIEIAVKELGVCKRTVRRRLRAFRRDGIDGLTRSERSDKGKARHISKHWRSLTLQIYKRLQKEGRQNSRAQTWVLIRGITDRLESIEWQDPDKLNELFSYYAQKLGAAEENKKSKINVLLGAIKKELEAGIVKPPRSHVSVYDTINAYLEQKKRKARHPGQGPEQFVMTTDGILYFPYTNDLFQADHTGLDILLIDKDGNEIGYPFLTVIIECTSGCIVGFYLGFSQPGSHEVALAFRQAILPKKYGPEYGLEHEWNCQGIPKYLMTDRAKEFKSQHLKQIAAELGFQLRYRAYPSQGGLVEAVFDRINKEVLRALPGYKGSNVQNRPKNAQKYACITVEELERELVRYFVNHYNWHLYPRVPNQTRSQRWQDRLIEPPNVPDERKLDLCLLKRHGSSKVQKFGTVQFLNEIYQGDCLLGRETEKISLRYDPSNIVQILAYTEEKAGIASKYIGVLKMRDRKEEKLSLKTLRFWHQLIRKAGKAIDQSSILRDVLDRNEFAENKVREGRKQRRNKEHDRAGCSEGLSNVIDMKRQESKQAGVNANSTPVAQEPEKRLKPKRSAIVAVTNWVQHLTDNW